MEINSIIQQFKSLVFDFSQHKDFSEQGNKVFKLKQKQLIDFSKNVHSLAVCLIVLENVDEPTTLYFASQFVKDKLKFQFQQLSQEAVVETHAKIINIMRTKANATKIIASNLALCLSFLYIHCYDKLGTALNFFKNTFASTTVPISPNLYYQYLFRYLDGIVCQIDSRRLVIDEMKRNQVLKHLRSQQTQILLALDSIYLETTSKNSTVKLSMSDLQNILYSFSEWLKIQQPDDTILLQIHNHSVLHFALQAIKQMETTQAATQCIISAFQTANDPEKYSQFYAFIGQNMNKLIQSVNKKLADEQSDEAENIIKVLAFYGRYAGKKLIDQCNQLVFVFLQSMVKCTMQPTLQVFKQLSDFWESMIYFMKNRKQSSPLTKQMADAIVGKLYITYCDRTAYSTSEVHELDELTQRQLAKLHQSVEDVRDRRQFARFIYQSICSYFGLERYIQEVVKIIAQTAKDTPGYWGKIQSYIYSLRDVVKSCVQPTQQLCGLLLLIDNLSEKHIIVIKSMFRVYLSLLSMQQKNEQFILKILGHAVLFFNQPLLSQKAGQVFQKCCEQNALILAKHLPEIYALLNQYPDKQYILVGLTYILKKNPSMLAAHLSQILKSPLQKIKQSTKKKNKKTEFDRLFTIIQCVPKGQTEKLAPTIQILLKQMWPILSQILKHPQSSQKDQDRLIEKAVKFLKLVMRSIPEQFIKYLKDIFTTVGEAYKKYPINSYVYLFEVTFTVYYKYKQEQLITYLKTLYQEYCKVTYQHLGTQQAIVNYQHLVDDFIGLNKRIVTYHTKMFLQSGQAQAILQFSIHCLGSGLPKITSSASQLFQIIFMIYWSPYCRQQYQNSQKGQVVVVDTKNAALYEQLKKFVLPVVPGLLRKMFKFLQTGPVQSARDNTLDCLQAVALAFPNESVALWLEPLKQLEQDILTQSQKQRLKQCLLKIGSNNHMQFLNSEQVVKRLFFTVCSRFLYRKSRAQGLLQ